MFSGDESVRWMEKECGKGLVKRRKKRRWRRSVLEKISTKYGPSHVVRQKRTANELRVVISSKSSLPTRERLSEWSDDEMKRGERAARSLEIKTHDTQGESIYSGNTMANVVAISVWCIDE